MITAKEVERRFNYVDNEVLSDDQVEKCELVRKRLRLAASAVAKNTPANREQSLAVTKLEEALSWAIAAIVRPT